MTQTATQVCCVENPGRRFRSGYLRPFFTSDEPRGSQISGLQGALLGLLGLLLGFTFAMAGDEARRNLVVKEPSAIGNDVPECRAAAGGAYGERLGHARHVGALECALAIELLVQVIAHLADSGSVTATLERQRQ
jgi:hypothetical protein